MITVYLTNWATVSTASPYTAPELVKTRLCGTITGHPRLEDGKFVTTSSIQKVEGRLVHTRNTVYKLGRIDPNFRKWLKKNRPEWDWRNPITVKG